MGPMRPASQDIFSYGSIISAFDRSSRWQDALQLLKAAMEQRRCTVNLCDANLTHPMRLYLPLYVGIPPAGTSRFAWQAAFSGSLQLSNQCMQQEPLGQ